jgi:hypothetical protein
MGSTAVLRRRAKLVPLAKNVLQDLYPACRWDEGLFFDLIGGRVMSAKEKETIYGLY